MILKIIRVEKDFFRVELEKSFSQAKAECFCKSNGYLPLQRANAIAFAVAKALSSGILKAIARVCTKAFAFVWAKAFAFARTIASAIV